MSTDFIYVAFKLICFDSTIKQIWRITGVVIDVNGEHLSRTSILFVDGNAKKKEKKKKSYRKREWKKFISYGYKKLNNRPVETMRKSIITNVSQGCVFFVIQGLYFITSFNIPSVHPFLVLSLQISFSLIILFFLELSFLFLPNRKLLI